LLISTTRHPLLLPEGSPEERAARNRLTMNLNRMVAHLQGFQHALELFEFANVQHFEQRKILEYSSVRRQTRLRSRRVNMMEGKPVPEWQFDDNLGPTQAEIFEQLSKYSSWSRASLHEGVLTIYNYARAMLASKKYLNQCPELQQEIEIEEIQAAWKKFEQCFPDWKTCRDAVSHDGDIIGDELSRHALKSDYVSASVSSPPGNLITDLVGRKFLTTWRGVMVGYEMSTDSVNHLKSVLDRFYVAFDPDSGLNKAFTRPEGPAVSRWEKQKQRRKTISLRREADSKKQTGI